MKTLSIIGETQVGKTSIIHSQNKKADIICQPTVSFDIYPMTVNGESFRVIDTAGQEAFHAVCQSVVRSSQIVMIVFDLTKRETFEQIQNFWIEFLTSVNLPDYILIVGNKKDLEDKRSITFEEGNNLCQKIIQDHYSLENTNTNDKIVHSVYFETSATQNENIDELFNFIADKFQNINIKAEPLNEELENNHNCSC